MKLSDKILKRLQASNQSKWNKLSTQDKKILEQRIGYLLKGPNDLAQLVNDLGKIPSKDSKIVKIILRKIS